MSHAFALLPLLLMPLLYGVFVRLSALLLRRKVRWSHALVFGLLGIVVGGMSTSLNFAMGMLVPMPVAILVGLALQLALGGWYFGVRATNATGDPIGFKGGAVLSLVAYLLVVLLGVLLAVVLPAFHRGP